MSGLVIRPTDWPIPVAGLICAAMIAVSAAPVIDRPQDDTEQAPDPAPPQPKTTGIAYAPAPGRDDRTPVEYVDQVFTLGDADLPAKLSGVGPVFWPGSGRGSGALIDRDVVLTTAHLFVRDGRWYGGNDLLPIPPDPARGSIFLAACDRSYHFTRIEVGDEAPRQGLGLDYAIARLEEPACDAASVLDPVAIDGAEIEALIAAQNPLLVVGAYEAADLIRYAEHPLMTGKEAREDGHHRLHVFGVRCALVGTENTGDHPKGSTGLFATEGCDTVPGGSGGPLLISRDGGRSYQIIGVANSYRPGTEYNNYTRIEGAFAAHLKTFLPEWSVSLPMAASRHPATGLDLSGPWWPVGVSTKQTPMNAVRP